MPQPETTTRSRSHQTTPVAIDGYETAVSLLSVRTHGISPVGQRLRERATFHLNARMYVELRGTAAAYATEELALSVLKRAARELRIASSALHSAAERLREKGDGLGANQTYRAHRAADDAAESLDPS